MNATENGFREREQLIREIEVLQEILMDAIKEYSTGLMTYEDAQLTGN